MNAQLDGARTILARIEKLELENRRLRRIAFAVLIVSSIGFLMGQARPQSQKQTSPAWEKQLIRAERIQAGTLELVNPEGHILAELMSDPLGDSKLILFDRDGKAHAMLSGSSVPMLVMGELKSEQGHVFAFGGQQTV